MNVLSRKMVSRIFRQGIIVSLLIMFSSGAVFSEESAAKNGEQGAEKQLKNTSAEESFSVHGNSIFQIRIMNASSKSQSALGSGFLVGDGRYLATNYHVVSSVVLEPKKYIAEIDIQETTLQAEVVALDVIHDLAILSLPTQGIPLALSETIPARGARLYSIGNPLDIGMTVVEGNYNGLVENRFFDQIHFSGAINSGMSGGPTLNDQGEVVGINVASAGNQVGFLVPVDKLSALLKKVEGKNEALTDTEKPELIHEKEKLAAVDLEPSDNEFSEEGAEPENAGINDTKAGGEDKNPFFQEIASQIQEATNYMIDQLLQDEWPLDELGEAKVVGKAHHAIDCWGDSAEDNDKKMKIVQKGCNSRDGFFISRRLNSGYIEYEFSYSQADDWPVSSFYKRMTRDYAFASPGNRAGKKDVDNYTCLNRIVTRDPSEVVQREDGEESNKQVRRGSKFKRKVSYCTRPYKKLKGIFDTFYMAVTLEKTDRVLMEHFTLSGVSKEDGERFLERFINQVGWK